MLPHRQTLKSLRYQSHRSHQKILTASPPRFEIVLHITNPNRDPLELEGISYTIHLEGNKVMSGVANDLPTKVDGLKLKQSGGSKSVPNCQLNFSG